MPGGPSTSAKTYKWLAFNDILAGAPVSAAARAGRRQVLMGGQELLRLRGRAGAFAGRVGAPTCKGEQPRLARLFKALRQIIESVNDTLKGQLDLEHHG
ncbi:hypothetical protein [Ornithinimicrobium faecis]|uniref:hypothetical protein n=1 Tax=Ornithinimicrobium faecis TaxID=2934158 RepID=UPI00211995FB|nr:hypothetical protein [Ornithinimicrobium sp. HY1745]